MSEYKFTPGPWDSDMAVDCYHDGKETFAVYSHPEPGHTVEIVETPDVFGDECIHGENNDQRQANANLISAAPELLKELESHCDACMARNNWNNGCAGCFTQRAIEKALGGRE